MAKLMKTAELLGALTSGFGSEAMEGFIANPGEFAAVAGVREHVKVQTVENTGDTINVALPYYSTLEKRAGTALDDDDLHVASGGDGTDVDGLTFMSKADKGIYNLARDAILHGDSFTKAMGTSSMDMLWDRYQDDLIKLGESK